MEGQNPRATDREQRCAEKCVVELAGVEDMVKDEESEDALQKQGKVGK